MILFVFFPLNRTNVVMNYTEIEAKVREATNDDTWGPHGTIMAEIARYTFTYEHFPEVMSMLWKRMLHENKKNWRRIYKVWTFFTCQIIIFIKFVIFDVSLFPFPYLDLLESCFCLFQSLLLLSYLVKNGSERVVTNTRDHIYDLRQLESFSHFDEYGKDQGINSKFRHVGDSV